MASAVLACLISVQLSAAGRPVTIRAEDGRSIQALVFEATQHPAPAVVLVPMLGATKDDWQEAGQRLAAANITALAIDLRSQSAGSPSEMASWQSDVRAAVTYLASRSDVRASAIGAAGASLGASLAAMAASSDVRVRSLALVSPALDYRGVRIEGSLRQYGARPALLLASLKDPYAVRSSRELAKNPPGLRETHWSETAAHGTVLLTRAPELVQVLLEWFQRTLGG